MGTVGTATFASNAGEPAATCAPKDSVMGTPLISTSASRVRSSLAPRSISSTIRSCAVKPVRRRADTSFDAMSTSCWRRSTSSVSLRVLAE